MIEIGQLHFVLCIEHQNRTTVRQSVLLSSPNTAEIPVCNEQFSLLNFTLITMF